MPEIPPSLQPTEEKFPRYEHWTEDQRQEFRRTKRYPKFSDQQMGHREPLPATTLPPQSSDRAPDGSYRFWDYDNGKQEWQFSQQRFNQAHADHNDSSTAYQDEANKRIKEAATAHGVEVETLQDVAKRILKSPRLREIAGVLAASPEVGDLLYTLSAGDTLNQIIETAKTDPNRALKVVLGMEEDVRKARLRSLNQPQPKERKLSGSVSAVPNQPAKIHPWARGGYLAFKEKLRSHMTGHSQRGKAR